VNIGEIAAQSGLQASTIRYYEKLGILKSPSRISGKRVYHSEVLHQLSLVYFAKALGFSLEEITVLVKEFPGNAKASPRWNRLATSKIQEMKDIIAKATAVQKMLEEVLQCDCAKLEDCARSLAHPRNVFGLTVPPSKSRLSPLSRSRKDTHPVVE
jgi:MerR family transcriptional regulator, redox-sensitive transcriptional activator SoxR